MTKNGVMGNLAAIDAKVAASMLLNFASSTGIVLTNKIVMERFGFKFGTTLTCFHFFMTFLCLVICSALRLFEIKKLPLIQVSKLAAASMGFVVLTNLSLQYNSVGFYQIAKVMTTPTVVFIEALVYQKYLEGSLRWTLVPICLGVMITAATDFRLNRVGTLYAIAGVIVTSFYQIWSGTLQKGLDCNALQLQFFTAPLSGLFIIPFLGIFDNWSKNSPDSILFYDFNQKNMMFIAVTGLFAFLVNISIFLVIGKSSPLTYNILGHAKTSFIILSDFVFFGRPFDFKNVSGVIIALVGVFWYTHLKLEKARKEMEAKASAKVEAITEPLTKSNSFKGENLSKSGSYKDLSAVEQRATPVSRDNSVNNG